MCIQKVLMRELKLTRREREKLSHRNQILADALELFQLKGYHNVSMHEIAGKSEFSVGTLYKYFKNKEELYSAIMIEKTGEISRIIDAVLSKEDKVENIVREYIDVKIRLLKENLALIKLLLAETQKEISFRNENGFGKVLRRIHERELTKLASLFEKGIQQKKFRKFDPYQMSVALNGLINAFLFNWLNDPEHRPYAGDAVFITEVFFKGCVATE